MIVPPECMLSVDVEGWKGHSAGCSSAAAVEPLAWRVREKPAMTADERSKLQKELIAVRDRQASDGKARGAPRGALNP